MVTKVSRGILGPFFHMKMSMSSQHLCRCILGDAGHTRHLLHKGRHSNQELSAFHVSVSPKSFLCTQTLSSQNTDARAVYQELSLKAKAGLPPPPCLLYRQGLIQKQELSGAPVTMFTYHMIWAACFSLRHSNWAIPFVLKPTLSLNKWQWGLH